MTKRVAFYARVSTDDQSTAAQIQALTQTAERNGWQIVGTYIDQGISGAKGRDQRPAFDKLHRDATRGEFDMVAAWSVDRLGRSLSHLVAFLAEMQALSVGLYLHQQALDTTTPAGRALYGMMGVFAEFERSMIVARVRSGMDRAKQHGTRSGKPIGRPTISRAAEQAIQADLMHADRKGLQAIARSHGVGTGTVQRIAADLKQNPPA